MVWRRIPRLHYWRWYISWQCSMEAFRKEVFSCKHVMGVSQTMIPMDTLETIALLFTMLSWSARSSSKQHCSLPHRFGPKLIFGHNFLRVTIAVTIVILHKRYVSIFFWSDIMYVWYHCTQNQEIATPCQYHLKTNLTIVPLTTITLRPLIQNNLSWLKLILQQYCLVYCCHCVLRPIPAAKRRSIFQLQRRPPSTQMPCRPATCPALDTQLGPHLSTWHSRRSASTTAQMPSTWLFSRIPLLRYHLSLDPRPPGPTTPRRGHHLTSPPRLRTHPFREDDRSLLHLGTLSRGSCRR